MKPEETLAAKKQAIDGELSRILSGGDGALYEAMRYAVLSGGKRYRPLLCLAAGECLGTDPRLLLPFACAVELIHNYSLIHDDLPVMDNDDIRRGQPSCHKAFGQDIALLAGNGLLTLAFEVMASAPLPEIYSTRREAVIQEMSRAAGAKGLLGGQLEDLRLQPEGINEKVLNSLILKKTGALIIASVKTAALLGAGTPAVLGAFQEYGKNVGLAFQIRDDILDSESQEGTSFFRPNYARFLGEGTARQRLGEYVRSAVRALEEASLLTEELRYLACCLLDVEQGASA